jgi:hypothetical protein
MSIVYSETKFSNTSKADVRNAASSDASVLFPGEAANLYRRNTPAAGGRSAKLAWIAAPIAVVVIGGGLLVALPHAKTVQSATATVSRTTVAPAATAKTAPTPLAPAPAAKARANAAIPQTVTSSERTTTQRAMTAPTAKMSRSTSSQATKSPAIAVAPTLPTAPQPYGAIQSAAQPGEQLGPTVASQPAQQAAPQTSTPTALTPGDFKFTAPPTGPAGASPAVSPSTAVTQPTVQTPQAQPQQQG